MRLEWYSPSQQLWEQRASHLRQSPVTVQVSPFENNPTSAEKIVQSWSASMETGQCGANHNKHTPVHRVELNTMINSQVNDLTVHT